MKLILSPITGIAMVATWLKYKFSDSFARDELSFYGAYGAMAGMHTYKKGGAWHFGYKGAPTETAESSTETQELEKAPRTVYTPDNKKQLVRSLPGR